jgi:hypothetical protein
VVGAPRAATDKTLTITTTRKTPLTKTLPKPQCSIRHRPKRQALRYGSQTNADHTPTKNRPPICRNSFRPKLELSQNAELGNQYYQYIMPI